MNKLAYSVEKFERETVLMPMVVAETCLREQFPDCDEARVNWFCVYADWHVRYLYANDKKWKRELKKEDPRDFLYVWLNHWAKAFSFDPERFIELRKETDGLVFEGE